MAVTFRILPQHALVLVRYDGIARIAETERAFASCALHPAFRPDFRHLVDMSRITAHEADYPAVMALQARLADWLVPPAQGPFLICLAPTGAAQAAARMVTKSWEGLGEGAVLTLSSNDEAEVVLGLPPGTLGEVAGAAEDAD